MSRKVILRILVVAIAAFGLCLAGCTLVGLGIGSLIDAGAKKTISGWEVNQVKPGKEITLYLGDGSVITGNYAGVSKVTEDEYFRAYSQFKNSVNAPMFLPSQNDTLTLSLIDGRKATGSFAGFDYKIANSIVEKSIFIKGPEKPVPQGAALKYIAGIQNAGGDSLPVSDLSALWDHGDFPVITAVSIQTAFEKKEIFLNRIMKVEIKGSNTGKTTGVVLGLMVDALILIGIASSSDDDSPPPPRSDYDGSVSCPFVYSFNGEEYILDSETFGGAIFKAAQRTDFDNLDYLRPVNGTLKLRITNELREIQYIDEIKLEVVDHPGNTVVIPSFEGQLHTFVNPIPPSSAIDYNGNKITRLIVDRDKEFWVSNPFGRNPDKVDEVRDGIILDFPRPPNSDFVKLALNVQNTDWAAYTQGEMLKLQGTELANWYDLMNRSPEARKALKEVMVREGMLLIQILNGENWENADYIWEVGPSVPKDQAVMIDISDIPGDTLRIRLESTAGFWMINSVVADYTSDVSVEVAELSLRGAVDYAGKDVLDALGEVDGDYYAMASRQDWADLEFTAPPSREGFNRTFVLKCTGYYTINVVADGEPQKELISHFMKVPGAYGQFVLKRLYFDLGSEMAELTVPVGQTQ